MNMLTLCLTLNDLKQHPMAPAHVNLSVWTVIFQIVQSRFETSKWVAIVGPDRSWLSDEVGMQSIQVKALFLEGSL